MMMEARPAATLMLAEADFLLEVVIIALDAPAQLGNVDKAAERHVRLDGCEPEFGERLFTLGPFDQQGVLGEPCFALDRPNAHAVRRRRVESRDSMLVLSGKLLMSLSHSVGGLPDYPGDKDLFRAYESNVECPTRAFDFCISAGSSRTRSQNERSQL